MLNKKILLPVAALCAAILIPIIFMGYSALSRAETEFTAKNYASAAKSFEQAARFLIWRNDLWDKAGISAAKNGDSSGAIEYFQHTTTHSEEGWTSLSSTYLALGKLDLVIATCKQGLSYYDSPNFYSLLAAAYQGQKKWELERTALENQLRLNPQDAYARYRLGLLLTVFEPQQALPNLMSASSLDPQFDPAVQTLRSALNLSATKSDASQQMLTVGRSLGLVQEWDLSRTAFEKAIALDAHNAEAWAWLGEAKQQKGQDGRADLDQAVTLDHKSVVVRALRGLYWNRQKKYSQMLSEYFAAAEDEPNNPVWQAEIGNSYLKLGDLVTALAAYQHATDLAPNESTYWRLLAVFCADSGVRLEDVGLPAAEKAVKLAPDDPFAADALGWSYLSSGRYANAEETLLDVIKRFPEHLPAHIHLAMTYLAQGNRVAAFDKLTYVQKVDLNGVDGETAKQLLKQYFP